MITRPRTTDVSPRNSHQAAAEVTRSAPTGAVVIGGDYLGLGIVRSLGRRGIPVVVVDDELSIAGRSRYTVQRVHVRDLRDPSR